MRADERYEELEPLREQADRAFAAACGAASELQRAVAELGFLQTGLWQAYTRAATARALERERRPRWRQALDTVRGRCGVDAYPKEAR